MSSSSKKIGVEVTVQAAHSSQLQEEPSAIVAAAAAEDEGEDEEGAVVGMKAHIWLTEIQVVEETITVNIYLYFHYRLPGSEDKVDPNKVADYKYRFKKCAESPSWVPKWFFYNQSEMQLNAEDYFYDERSGTVIGNTDWCVTIKEPLELQRFPFDRQLFKVIWRCENGRVAPWSLPPRIGQTQMPDMKDQAVVAQFMKSTWRLDKVFAGAQESQGMVLLIMSRSATSYLWNVVFVMWLIVQSNVIIVGIDPLDLADRMSITLTLLLTSVAFKFVIASYLPPVTYQTLMDWYCTASFLMLGAVMAENGILVWIADEDLAVIADRWFAVGFTGLWCALHVLIVFGAWRDWFYVPIDKVMNEDNTENQTVESGWQW